jgi:hypothetical protein
VVNTKEPVDRLETAAFDCVEERRRQAGNPCDGSPGLAGDAGDVLAANLFGREFLVAAFLFRAGEELAETFRPGDALAMMGRLLVLVEEPQVSSVTGPPEVIQDLERGPATFAALLEVTAGHLVADTPATVLGLGDVETGFLRGKAPIDDHAMLV